METQNTFCAVCRRKTETHQRYGLRAEASRGGLGTVLHQQLTALVPGVDVTHYEFVCRGCKNNIVTATNLKYRYEEAKKVILQKFPASVVSKTPPRVQTSSSPSVPHSSRPPRKRPQQSPGARSGITPQSKRYLRERNESKCTSPLAHRTEIKNVESRSLLSTRRSLFPSSNAAMHEDMALALPQPAPLLPSRIPRTLKVCNSA